MSEIPVFDPLPEGQYLCEVMQAEAASWSAWGGAGCVNLRLRVVSPDDWLGQMIRSSTALPTTDNGPASSTVQRYRELVNAIPLAFVKDKPQNLQAAIGETVVAIVTRPPLDRDRSKRLVRVRHRSLWQGPEFLDVKSLKQQIAPTTPAAGDDVLPAEIDAARFRLLEKKRG